MGPEAHAEAVGLPLVDAGSRRQGSFPLHGPAPRHPGTISLFDQHLHSSLHSARSNWTFNTDYSNERRSPIPDICDSIPLDQEHTTRATQNGIPRSCHLPCTCHAHSEQYTYTRCSGRGLTSHRTRMTQHSRWTTTSAPICPSS